MKESRKQRYKALLNNKTHVRAARRCTVRIQWLFITAILLHRVFLSTCVQAAVVEYKADD